MGFSSPLPSLRSQPTSFVHSTVRTPFALTKWAERLWLHLFGPSDDAMHMEDVRARPKDCRGAEMATQSQ